jgi:hypothetical protein
LQKILKKIIEWIADALAARITEKFDAIDKRLDRLEHLHEQDAAALECDLSMMDDRICYLIGVCRKRGYTTAEERRRVTRMHDAYRARGGNHGEENEYAAFLALPSEEEYERSKKHEEH